MKPRYLAGAAVVALLAGCGGSDSSDDSANVDAAVKAAKAEKANIPLWDGATYKGTANSSTEVCVDETITKKGAKQLGLRDQDRHVHVIVTMPKGTIGDPQAGTCDKPL